MYEVKEQFDEAALSTSHALASVRQTREQEEEYIPASTGEEMSPEKKKEDEKKISPEIAVMQPILRLLQLLCENHNRDLQVCGAYKKVLNSNFGTNVLL